MGKPEVDVAGLCEVDESHFANDVKMVSAKYNKTPELVKDYRKMLDNKDIDAVIIGTPDHWHCLNLIHAVEAGKDAYCEKPISHDITEAKAMAAAAKHFNKIVQVGTWQRSTPEFVSAVEYIRAGKLGKVTIVRAWKTDPTHGGNVRNAPVPAEVRLRYVGRPGAVHALCPRTHALQMALVLQLWRRHDGRLGRSHDGYRPARHEQGTDMVMPTEVSGVRRHVGEPRR